jgi:putative transcriptional regulator
MQTQSDSLSDFLDGKLLVAMPSMGDPRFERTVIFMCSHSDEGAMGLIVNKPAHDLSFGDLLEQLDIAQADPSRSIHVHFGGPVEHGRGFVLHSREYGSSETTLEVTTEFGMTATLDILEDIANGEGPKQCILALGYAGWATGQLEAEIQDNGWLVCEADPGIVFGDNNSGKWDAALNTLGIHPSMLSAEGGMA